MAKPIQETPVLFGKDAKRFIAYTNDTKKVSTETRETVKANYTALKSISKF
jgi:hypothetical protein